MAAVFSVEMQRRRGLNTANAVLAANLRLYVEKAHARCGYQEVSVEEFRLDHYIAAGKLNVILKFSRLV